MRTNRFLPACPVWFSFAAVALSLWGCHHADDSATGRNAPSEPVKVTLTPVTRAVFPQTVEVTGSLYGDEETTISAQVPGRVVEMLVDIGDRVAPGDRLAQIDETGYRLAIEERKQALDEVLARLGLTSLPEADFDVTTVATVRRAIYEAMNARAKRDRMQHLFEQQPPVVSEQDYQNLVTAHLVAEGNRDVAMLEARSLLAQAHVRKSELATAQQRLADAAVRAPTRPQTSNPKSDKPDLPSYAVVERLASVGEYVREGDPLYRLVADHPLKYRASVPERFLQVVKVGQTVTLRTDDSSEDFVGTVSRISPAVNPQTRTFLVEAVVENTQRQQHPGSFARGAIHVGERTAVVYIPRSSLVSFAGLDKIYTVSEGKAVEHTVTLLSRIGDQLPISEPLDADRVVAVGASQLAAEMPVEVHEGG